MMEERKKKTKILRKDFLRQRKKSTKERSRPSLQNVRVRFILIIIIIIYSIQSKVDLIILFFSFMF